MSILERLRLPMIDAGEHEIMGRLLNELAASLPGRIEPLEWLVDMYGRTSDSFRLPDALANFGEALAAQGQNDRAKQVLEQLLEREPENDSAKRKLNNVLRKMGLAAPEEPAGMPEPELPTDLVMPAPPKLRPDAPDEAPKVVIPAAAGMAEPPIDDETQKFIAQSLTDVDLFASYGLTQKAISLLEAILRRAPRHTTTLEKLLDFVLGAGDDRRTAELAALLETIHQNRGDARGGERFGELRRRFQRAAGLTDEEIDSFISSIPHALVPAAPVSHPQNVAAEGVHDVSPDDSRLKVPDVAAAPPVAAHRAAPPQDFPEFHLPADQAEAPQHAEFDISPQTSHAAEEVNPFAEISAELPETLASETSAPASDRDIEEHILDVPMEDPALELPPAVVGSTSKDSEFDLDQPFDLILESEPLVPAHEQRPPEVPIVAKPETAAPRASSTPTPAPPSESKVFASDKFLADLAKEMGDLGLDELIPSTPSAAIENSPAPVAAKTEAAAPSGPLQEVFDQFRAELGEMGAEEEDLETHYNLGIAFREMGLLEEAISEFQKVAKAIEKGKPFRYGMQCCTLLGLAFIEKGQPAIAAIWYERALHTPDIDSESLLALRYDLGMAQESAGEMEAARKSFSQVYAVNIDYRDVAERIAALQKPSR
jgi:tetratricopeptide (TPR) repeat protein